MALVENNMEAVSVITISQCVVICINKEKFDKFVAETPEMHASVSEMGQLCILLAEILVS